MNAAGQVVEAQAARSPLDAEVWIARCTRHLLSLNPDSPLDGTDRDDIAGDLHESLHRVPTFKPARHEIASDELAVVGHPSWMPELLDAREAAIASRVRVEPCVTRRLANAIQAHAAEDFVGGALRAGRLDARGFRKSG